MAVMRTSPLLESEEASMPILPTTSKRGRGRGRSLTLHLPAEVEERLLDRIRQSGVPRGQAVALLLSFAMDLEAEIHDIEPELGWYAANRRIPLPRALAQLAARSLGIEPVEVYAPVAGSA
jgi:hypothetical protein